MNDNNKHTDLNINLDTDETNNNEVIQQPKAAQKSEDTLDSVIARLNKFNFKTATTKSLKSYSSDLALYKKLKGRNDREELIAVKKKELEAKRNPFLKEIELCIQSITSNDVIDNAISAGITAQEFELEIIEALSGIKNSSLKSVFLSQYKTRKSKINIYNSLNKNGEV